MPGNDIVLSVPERRLARSLGPGLAGVSMPTWDLYLDGALVASEIGSEQAARLELDMVAWCAMFGEATLVPDLPLTDEALDLALSIFEKLFLTPKVREKARTALETIIRPAIYTINRDGSLSVMASSTRGRKGAPRSYAITALTLPREHSTEAAPDKDTYQVTITCECMDYRTRAHEHGGCCKHVAARLLLYLAQQGVGYLKHLCDTLAAHAIIRTSTADASRDAAPSDVAPAPTEALAFLEIGRMELSALLFLAVRTQQPVVLRAAEGTLQLTAGALSLSVPCADGGGHAMAAVERADIASLYDQLHPIAQQIATLTIFIDPSDRTIAVCGNDSDFASILQGRDIATYPAGADAAQLAALQREPALII